MSNTPTRFEPKKDRKIGLGFLISILVIIQARNPDIVVSD